jgi:hypothetical protein
VPRFVRFMHFRAPWLNRILARLTIWLAGIEFRVFRGVMEWPDDSGQDR